MARHIQVEVEGVVAEAELCDALSPRTAEAFWQSLPIEATLTPVKWSGAACFFRPGGPHLSSVTANEMPVASIYPGYIVIMPGGEALIAYGASECRSAGGTEYTTRVARLLDRGSDLLKVVARTHDEGSKTIKITRIGAEQ
ncbi:MAG: DUF3830 family protein [Chloroflexi bacterium]|nr:DUF3830 family protein [Chloroflexota bacterium]